MNRNEEYTRLLAELDSPAPAVASALARAKARYARRRWIYRPAAGLASVFVLFVLLVNFCTPVALACSKVPVLRELAEAVTFSRSLTDAVDNAYVQQVALEQTDNGVTARVEYLIVDQKQVNVFFRLDSEIYNCMDAIPEIKKPDGSGLTGYSCGLNDRDVPNGQLRSVTIDFVDNDVPGSLRLALNIMDHGGAQQTTEPYKPVESLEDALLADHGDYTPDYIASFDFLLEFDPEFTAAGKTLVINQTVELDGQRIALTTAEIYPTHLRLNVADNPDNTSWLRRLNFRIETDRGTFDTVKNGIIATGSPDSPMMVSYRADSPYFYEAKHLKVVITGAQWLRKDMETIRIDLAAGTAERMPDGTELADTVRRGGGWIIAVKAAATEENAYYQVFRSDYYDAEGNEYAINSWNSTSSYGDFKESEGYFYEIFPLKDYPFDEVWLSPSFSHEWTAPEPVTVIIR